jgi:hypothetical protein
MDLLVSFQHVTPPISPRHLTADSVSLFIKSNFGWLGWRICRQLTDRAAKWRVSVDEECRPN